MKAAFKAFCLLTLIVLAACATPPTTSTETAHISQSESAAAAGDFDWVLSDMEYFLEAFPRSRLRPRALFLQGQAARMKVDRMRASRGMDQMKNVLSLEMVSVEEVDLMEKAFASFKECGELAKDTSLAAEAWFQAAGMADINYLKHMEVAINAYHYVADAYPGSPYAPKARDRYDRLQSYYRGITGHPLATKPPMK